MANVTTIASIDTNNHMYKHMCVHHYNRCMFIR